MKISIPNNISNSANPRIDTQSFINELENFIEKLQIKKDIKQKDIPILSQIEAKRNISIVYRNRIRKNIEDILTNYSQRTGETVYFVHNKIQDSYNIYKYEKGIVNTYKLKASKLPKTVEVNNILKMKSGKYIEDKTATKEIKNKIINMANKVLDKQDMALKKFRKEGHLYMVEETINDRVFLIDLNNREDGVIEEVNFPKKLKNQASEGSVFKYSNNEYVYYSNNGF